jgi:hyperosmotically inducible protein
MLVTSSSQSVAAPESGRHMPTRHSLRRCCDVATESRPAIPRCLPDNPFLKEITMHNHSLIRRSMIAAALTLTFAAVPLSQAVAQDSEPAMQASDNQTVPDKAADAWITTKVKTELGTTKGVTATDINVTTNDGVVTLTGNVESSMEKNHAVRVARQIKGVKSVDASGLMVGPARHDDNH